MKYTIISGEKNDVEDRVDELLEKGWILHGSVCFQRSDTEWSKYAQAMIKVEEKDSK